jgi:hypothetical protein
MSNDHLTPEEIDDYGRPFLDVVAKQARSATAAEIAQLKNSVAQVEHVLHQERRRQMTKLLDERIPDWRATNEDPGFLQWLQGRDAFSGKSRHQLLQDAWASGRGENVLNIFMGYRAEGRQQPAGQQGAQGASWNMPNTGGHSRDWATEGTPTIITGRQVKAFYDDVAAGKYEHRQQQKQALEAALQRALSAGRVTE